MANSAFTQKKMDSIEGLVVNRNYLKNGTSETLGSFYWNRYNDSSTTRPVDGTGGTPGIDHSFDPTTSAPLSLGSSFLFTKTNTTSIQGKGVSTDFTIDNCDQAKPLQIEFDFSPVTGSPGFTGSNTVGTNSDLIVYIYDVTNSSLIEPQGILLEPTINGQFYRYRGTFQTAVNSTSYRLILHAATANNNNYTMKFDNFRVSRQIIPNGAVVTDWQSYTPTFTGLGTVTSIEFISRRVGDTLEILGKYTTGTTTATEARITLGFSGANSSVTSADTTKLPTIKHVGASTQSSAAAVYETILVEPSVGYITLGLSDGTRAGLTKQLGTAFSSTTAFSFFAKIPIQGWSSNIQTSNDTDTRVVASSWYLAGNTAITSTNTITFDTKNLDTHGTFSSGVYTVPVAGVYNISAKLLTSSGTGTIAIYKNGVNIENIFSVIATGNIYSGDSIQTLASGDLITIRPLSNMTFVGGGTDRSEVNIHRLSGPSLIAATETTAFRAMSSTTAVTALTNPFLFTTINRDTHNGYSAASGRYTTPQSGWYQITGSVYANAGFTLRLYIGTGGGAPTLKTQFTCTGSAASGAGGTDLRYLLAGDTIELRSDANVTASATNQELNFFTAVRVGN